MGEFKKIINSEERKKGLGFKGMALLFLLPVIGLATMYFDIGSRASLLGAIAFSIAPIALYFTGIFYQKKYNSLGATPLTLIPSFCTIGDNTSGSVTIKKQHFKKVKEMSLTLIKFSKNGPDTFSFKQVWQTSITPQIKFSGDETVLNFEFIIPLGMKPTHQALFSQEQYHWEISFEFIELMESIKRTWKIPVYR